MTDLTLSPIILGSLNLVALEPSTGVLWAAETIDGWGSPGATLTATQRARAHGAWGSESYLKARPVSVSGYVDAPSESALSDAIDRLNAAVTLADTTLSVSEGGRVRTLTVRRQDEVTYTKISPTSAAWSFQVVALDPRKYGAQIVQTTALPTSSGGLTLPLTVPFSIDSTVNTGTIGIHNPGTIPSPLVLRVDGPCSGPILSHVGQGRQLILASSYVIAAGSWLTIDMDKRTVMENDQASRAGFITSRGWFNLDPGDNSIGFNAAVYDAAARLTATGSPAYY